MLAGLLAFACGVLYDIVNIFFLKHVEGGNAWRAAFFSMFVGGAAVTGFLEAAHDPNAKWWLIAGYGVGTYIAMKMRPGKTAAANSSCV